jgi:patatin-like phospholipase/acyl hydrolase
VKRVLAIDGGGVRGVLPASFLAAVEEQIESDVVDYFDLIVGTSTGGIIALGLGAGLSAAEIRDFYLKRGPRIFSGISWLRKARRLARAKYDHQQLRTEIEDIFGERKLGESRTRLVIPSMDVNSGKGAHLEDRPQRAVRAGLHSTNGRRRHGDLGRRDAPRRWRRVR